MNNSGKYLEDMLQKHVVKQGPETWVHRFADSHSARNLIGQQPADFLMVNLGDMVLVECKSMKGHRLKKFAQLPRMVMAGMAGVIGKVLVHRWDEDVYYVISTGELDPSKASWPLKDFDAMTWDEAMEKLLWKSK